MRLTCCATTGLSNRALYKPKCHHRIMRSHVCPRVVQLTFTMASQSVVGGITGFPVAGGMPLPTNTGRGRVFGTSQQFQNPNAQWIISQPGLQAPAGLGNCYGSGARVPASSQPPARRDRSPSGSRRQRSRERSKQCVDMETDLRTTPAGPQKGSDWLHVLEASTTDSTPWSGTRGFMLTRSHIWKNIVITSWRS